MSSQNFTTSFTVDQSPEEVYAAINNVRDWWIGEIEGENDTLGAQFTYRMNDVHRSTQEVTGLIPGMRIVWRVVDGHLNFVKDASEWKGTDIVFAIAQEGEKTVVRFTHIGLKPEVECYENCSAGWRFYIDGSLQRYITTGQAQTRAIV